MDIRLRSYVVLYVIAKQGQTVERFPLDNKSTVCPILHEQPKGQKRIVWRQINQEIKFNNIKTQTHSQNIT